MVWPHPPDVIQYARTSYYFNNVYISYLIFVENLEKMSQNLSSAAGSAAVMCSCNWRFKG